MLKKYQYYLGKKNIPYYWNEHYNFVGNLQASALENLHKKITKVIMDVEKNLETEPYVIAKYLGEISFLGMFKYTGWTISDETTAYSGK